MLRGLLKTMRPHQWVKNLFVFAPVVFARQLFDIQRVLDAVAAVALFSLLASAIYILNDLVDIEADRAHPVKKHRPLASGRVPVRVAKQILVILAGSAIGLGTWLAPGFGICALSYFLLNVTYSFGLKRIPYLDVLCIATGFELRVLSGAFAADLVASRYLLLVTFLLATFLGLGKRLHELVHANATGAGKTRSVLKRYNQRVLTVLLLLTGLATVGTYGVYTLDPAVRQMFHTDYLVVSTVFTLFGVLRFTHLIRHRPDAESPTEEMLRDRPFLLNLLLWAVTVVSIIYVGHA